MLAHAALSSVDDSSAPLGGISALMRARRFLGRVLDTVRRPSDMPPPFEGRAIRVDVPRAEPMSMIVASETAEPSKAGEAFDATDIEAQLQEKRLLREEAALRLQRLHARSVLDARLTAWEADLTWIGIRVESEGDQTLVAWRVTEADLLRTVEVRCAIGDENSLAEATTEDVPAGMNVGSTVITSDALRLVVALGVLEEGRFVSRAHAVVR